MPWFKVDDKLHSHKKVAKAGDAMALWVVAGSWCSDQLTDGFVPDYMAGRLVPGGSEMADTLVEAGLWVEGEHDGDDGWWFHDWSDKNPTADEVEAKREAARERMRKVRSNKSDSSDDVRANKSAGSPYPEPVPEPNPEPQEPTTSDADAPDPEVSDDARALTRTFALAVKANGHAIPTETSKARTDWLVAMDRLLRIGPPGEGGHIPDRAEVERVIEFATTDDFERGVVQSAPKFRKRYSSLRIKAGCDAKPNDGVSDFTGQGGTSISDWKTRKANAS